ncbi:aminoglycoside phosphotransferase family protein [Acidovorax sp. JHL-3]|uniref:aminoglycoside phosphotransferase family protein n=1 Tax=Acidovorax sp. JHL-3 TaxID=1276755 RepID=UPI0004637985|nr:phosphotransferase [Acidovorax sp. JHL-3]
MSHPSSPPTPLAAASPAPASPVSWPDAARQAAFEQWLAPLVQSHQLLPASLRPASADASFRRYLRIDSAAGASCIVMDAPPDKENCRPFVQVQALMAAAGLNVPHILAWDEPGGFMLLSDLGNTTLIELLTPENPQAALGWYLQATDVLLDWQKASKPGVLPAYDEALLRRELALFPDWYLGQHRGITLDGKQQATLARAFDAIVAHNLAAPNVFVHRDFMTRNLMAPTLPAARGSLPPGGALAALGRPGGGSDGAADAPLGVLDFQDAVYGPITYDIASLLRDAFISWEEEFIIDVTVRYWEKARKAGLLGAHSASGWGDDFGEFYRAVEWMGLQRHLKVAGIFARLTLRDGKPKYLADAPRFMGYIRATAHRYRQLGPLLKMLDQIEGTEPVTGFAYGRM